MRSLSLRILFLFFSPSFLLGIPSRVIPSSPTTEVQDGQTGTLIVLPPQPTETGTKLIPDAEHPFIPPGPDDQRGREYSLSSIIP